MAEKRTITAYVAADPELITPRDGKEFAAFPVVENKRYKDPETQEWKDAKSTRYEVTVDHPKLRANLLVSLEKGQRVKVEGNYVPKPYVDGKGNQRVGHKIFAHDVSASYMHEPQGRGGVAPDRTEELGTENAISAEQGLEMQAGTWGQNPDPYPEHSQQFAARGQSVHQQYTPPPPPDHAPDAGLGR